MSDCRFGVSPVNYPDPDPVGFVMRRLICLFILHSSSWCQGLSVAYDCYTPSTFLLTFFIINSPAIKKHRTEYRLFCQNKTGRTFEVSI